MATAVPSLEEQLLVAAAAGDLEEVERCIELEADVDYPGQTDGDGVSALMKAAEGGHAEVVAALLQRGAPWNAQDGSGYCAGEYAMGSKHQAVVDLLLDFGVQAELVLGALTRRMQVGGPSSAAANADYLQQKLVYKDEQLLDADGEAVMMGWERPLMVRHAQAICAQAGASVINVGFGLGIVDEAIQSHSPSRHTIVEAHPDVYAHMRRQGWDKRPNVRILFGRWQDVLPQLLEGAPYDGVFFDTYGEYYEELREFQNHLPQLLAPRTGIYSFFNGLASDNIFFHMVYCRLIQLELAAKGLSTRYEPIAMKGLDDAVWEGVRNKYWHFETYFLPLCRMDEALLREAEAEAVAEAAAEAAQRREEEEEQNEEPQGEQGGQGHGKGEGSARTEQGKQSQA